MQEDTRIKTLCPFDHRAIEVWVRDGNGRYTAQLLYPGCRLIVYETDAVPQYIASLCLDQVCSLTNRERRSRANARKMRFMLYEGIVMAIFLHRGQRGPFLSFMSYILTLIQANGTATWGCIAFRELRSACHTNPKSHMTQLLSQGMRLL